MLRVWWFHILNYSFFYAQLFPDLSKIVLLDDDVVVQHDISSLWELDLNGKVSGSVFKSWCGDGDTCCHDNKYTNYFNFSHRFISSYFNPDHCAWLYGLNVFDLQAWRRTNITQTYLQWSKLVSRHTHTQIAYSTSFSSEIKCIFSDETTVIKSHLSISPLKGISFRNILMRW